MHIVTAHRDFLQAFQLREAKSAVRPTSQLLAHQRMLRANRSAFFDHHPAEPDYGAIHAALISEAAHHGDASFDGKCLQRAAAIFLDHARDQAAHIRDWSAHQQTGGGAL